MFDSVLLIVGILLVIIGFIGCILPVIPGPPLSFLGILALEYTRWGSFTSDLLWTFGFVVIVVTVIDYIVPVWGTKKFGGSKAGVWGASIGLIIGLFLGPLGILFGPFIGAFIGEMTQQQEKKRALKAASGAFFGLLMGVGLKLSVSGLMAYYFFKELFI